MCFFNPDWAGRGRLCIVPWRLALLRYEGFLTFPLVFHLSVITILLQVDIFYWPPKDVKDMGTKNREFKRRRWARIMIILIIPPPQKLIKRYTDTVQVQVLRRSKKEIRYFLKVAATRDFWHFFRISKSNTPWAPDKQTKVFGLAERFVFAEIFAN